MSPAMRAFSIILVALASSWLLSLSTPYQRLALWLDDAQQATVAREYFFEDSLVVDIDEESLRQLEPFLGVWPYKRDIFALLADYLGEAGVRALAFDILLSERRAGDSALGQAAQRNGNLVFAAAGLPYPLAISDAERQQLQAAAWVLPATLPRESWSAFSLPLAELWAPPPAAAGTGQGPSGAGPGIISMWPDVDGTVRRIPLFHEAQGSSLPTLALAALYASDSRPSVAHVEGQLTVGRHVWSVDDRGRATLNYPRNRDSIRTAPFYVLALAAMGAPGAQLDTDWLKGKTVFIGSSAIQADSVPTPRGLLSGAHVLALTYENLAHDLFLKPANPLVDGGVLAIALLLPLALLRRRPPSLALIGLGVLAGLLLAYLLNLALLHVWQQQSSLLFVVCAVILAGLLRLAVLTAVDARRRQEAEHQMRIAAAVFDASKEAIFVTDARLRIVSINPAFTDITGYQASEVLGRRPRVLSSRRNEFASRRLMREALAQIGYWRGERYGRRKSGETYPQWLSVSSVADAQGKVERWIAIFSDISAHKAAEEKISFLAHFDPLTRLPNRNLLQDRLNLSIAAASRTQQNVILMFLDLDRFKNINDSLGHLIGDQLLKQLALRLAELLREGDSASRLGGDEFVLLLPNTSAEGAAHVAGRILEAVAKPFTIGHHELNVSASIGIAEYPENGSTLDDLSRCADSALYRAKHAGRNNYQFYTAEMHERACEVLSIENSLRHALARGEFRLYYQPQVDARTRQMVGMEALIRWQHPVWGLVAPDQFIPIAEESGQIREIGDWVIREVLAQIQAWRAAGLPVVPVAINLSLAQFRQSQLCDQLIDALAASAVEPTMLELELTESVAMENLSFTIDSIDRMRENGIRFAIDDFGTGYSSLSHLKRFRADRIKIDKSFVRNLSVDNDDRAIVTAIINLAHNLGSRVVAEGVETAEQLDFLCAQGCDEIQGYYFQRPADAGQLALLFGRSFS